MAEVIKVIAVDARLMRVLEAVANHHGASDDDWTYEYHCEHCLAKANPHGEELVHEADCVVVIATALLEEIEQWRT